ncbi:MAG TPA: outer membrane beta-barrel protein [Paludibacter sp.]|nr:outer membrane beta-barrel protein [Paludibacter sp.]
MFQTWLKRIVFFVVLALGGGFHAYSQIGNMPYVDDKFLHFGFSLGVNTMDFGINTASDSMSTDVSTLKPGFSVGIISDMRINRYLNLRFTPTLHLSERQLNYKSNTGFIDSVSINSIPVALPFYLKYSAERKNNYRPYIIWGGGAYIDLGRKTSDVKLILKPIDFYTEFGVGCDLYFSFFKLSPELKFAVGFNDMLTHDYVPSRQADEIYTKAISKLTSRMLTLTFNFE